MKGTGTGPVFNTGKPSKGTKLGTGTYYQVSKEQFD